MAGQSGQLRLLPTGGTADNHFRVEESSVCPTAAEFCGGASSERMHVSAMLMLALALFQERSVVPLSAVLLS